MKANEIIEQCNELLEDKTYFLQTIELTKEEVKVLTNEIERLNSIIKEVREYCINRSQYFNEARIEQYTFSREEEYSIENILEILDKE